MFLKMIEVIYQVVDGSIHIPLSLVRPFKLYYEKKRRDLVDYDLVLL